MDKHYLKEFCMFWIIVLAVVIVIVIFGTINSRKTKEREKAEAAAAAEKRKEEQERMIKELETQAAAGDAVAAEKLTIIKKKINEPLVYDNTSRHYGFIHYRAQNLDTVYRTAGNILLEAIAGHGGWDDFVIEKERDSTNQPDEGYMSCSFIAATGESCMVEWSYHTKGHCTRHNGGSVSVHTGYFDISANMQLKMPPETVAVIVEEFTREITSYIKSHGGYQVCITASQFYEPRTIKLTEIWDS
jgi:hypothetical protein